MPTSAAIEAVVNQFGLDLSRRHPGIHCHVTVEMLDQKDWKRPRHLIRIDIAGPGGELSVTRDSAHDPLCDDVHSLLGAAFADVDTQLDTSAKQQREELRSHSHEPLGRISSLFPEHGYGVISTNDEQEVYFHESIVANEAFSQLARGSKVRFTFGPGDSGAGPLADSVYLLPW